MSLSEKITSIQLEALGIIRDSGYEQERKELNQQRKDNQDKCCNIVFCVCILLTFLLIGVYAWLVLTHN